MAGNRGYFISDRSGFRYPRSEMVVEPGTGYVIARCESDGRFNAVDHPQAHVTKYITFDDPKVLENVRPDEDHSVSTILLDEDNEALTFNNDYVIEI